MPTTSHIKTLVDTNNPTNTVKLGLSKGGSVFPVGHFDPTGAYARKDDVPLILPIDPLILAEFDSGVNDANRPLSTGGVLDSDSRPGMSGNCINLGAVTYRYIFFHRTDEEEFNFGTDIDFTIEFWYKSYLSGLVKNGYFFSFTTDGHSSYNRLQIFSSTKQTYLTNHQGYSTGMGFQLGTESPVEYTVWRHMAITRQGHTFRMFENGLKVYEGVQVEPIGYTGCNFIVGGRDTVSTGGIHASYDGIRVIKGKAVYTDTFTPVNGPYPDVY